MDDERVAALLATVDRTGDVGAPGDHSPATYAARDNLCRRDLIAFDEIDGRFYVTAYGRQHQSRRAQPRGEVHRLDRDRRARPRR